MNSVRSCGFDRYIGIDYSGARTPTASLAGLRIYVADRDTPPVEVEPPPSPRKYWTRRGVAAWLMEQLSDGRPAIVGIDHGFSFPLRYFRKYRLDLNWRAFLDDFRIHWPTDEDHVYVDFVRTGEIGAGAARQGDARWRRLTETRAGAAKSVFHFDVPGSVAKSTHAGLPWLRHLCLQAGDQVRFWPFDGWQPSPGRSLVAEVYPSLWHHGYEREQRTGDQHDAWVVAAWLREADREGRLHRYFSPALSTEERAVAEIEGWILGVM